MFIGVIFTHSALNSFLYCRHYFVNQLQLPVHHSVVLCDNTNTRLYIVVNSSQILGESFVFKMYNSPFLVNSNVVATCLSSNFEMYIFMLASCAIDLLLFCFLSVGSGFECLKKTINERSFSYLISP